MKLQQKERYAVLITRPAAQGKALSQAIARLGYQPVHLPLFAIQLYHKCAAGQYISRLDLYDTVIVTSKNAAIPLMQWLDVFWPKIPEHPQFYAVGRTTAAYLTRREISAKVPEQMHSEGLLHLLKIHHKIHGRILICKGLDGRNLLETSLRKTASSIDVSILYRRIPLLYEANELAEKIRRADKIICTSTEILLQLYKLTHEAGISLRHLSLIVSSPRLFLCAKDMGFSDIFLSKNATDQDLIACLASLV